MNDGFLRRKSFPYSLNDFAGLVVISVIIVGIVLEIFVSATIGCVVIVVVIPFQSDQTQ